MSEQTNTPDSSAAEAATIEDYFHENRTFAPSEAFVAAANLSDRTIYATAAQDPEAFWAAQARDSLTWFQDFHTTLEWDLPNAKWFLGGKLDVTKLDQMMNDLGRDGWELVAAFDTNQVYGNTKDAVLIFKRPRDR